MTTSSPTPQTLRGAAAPLFISALFALLWGVSGSLALPGGWRFVAVSLVVLITLGLVAVGVLFSRNASSPTPSQKPSQRPTAIRPAKARTPVANPPTDPFRTTAYRVSVAAMLVALPVAGRSLTLSGRGDAIMPVAAIIVGLHFLGLVSAFRRGIFAWVAGAFCTVGAAALLLPVQVGEPEVALRQVVVGLGCALVLWLSVLPLALQMSRHVFRARASAPRSRQH